jgi:uncharacterized protein
MKKKIEDAVLLRIFIGEGDRDRRQDRSLSAAVVFRAREAGLAGATVLAGKMGFGRGTVAHAERFEIATDPPDVVEIVDSEERINSFLAVVEELLTDGLVTLEPVRIVR